MITSTMSATTRGGPAVQIYMEANDRMHEGMDIAYTGDVDFVKGMILHHEDAIDMARIVF